MSVIIQLPDGSEKEFPAGVRAVDVAEDISPRLAKAAFTAEIDGTLRDLTAAIPEGTHSLRILTDRDEESIQVLRHTAAHVLAQAMRRLYGDDVKYTIGPALTDDFQYGFYYDFDLPEPIGSDDLEKIEQAMARIVQEDLDVHRIELPVDQAKQRLAEIGQDYKVEMIDDLIADEGVEQVSLYKQGEFLDMCRGPHLPSTGKLKAFKLLTTAGAYWRGDQSNKMLTRVYGTAFFDKKQLAEQIERIEQARKRDHRVLGKQLGLFLLTDAVGPGLPLWLPRGTVIREQLESWLAEQLRKGGYDAVRTPHIGKLDLYRTSGHYPYYSDSQFPPIRMADRAGQTATDKLADPDQAPACCGDQANAPAAEGYLLKPMNCPHHIQIYKAAQRSYRDLPIRLSEFGTVYRFEQSGELNGLTRVRGFTQDDAHIFCTPQQLEEEVEACVDLVKSILGQLGLDDYRVRVGLRDPDSSKYTGPAENWDQAENNLRSVVRKLEMNYTEEPGEAAFYGPKIDFVVTDCIGREWQLGTIQVDYNLPERFELEYIGADNAAHRPIMIHRAPFGSIERFLGILIEHFAGDFPLWLTPVQAAVLPVSDKVADYAESVAAGLKEMQLRVDLDRSAEKIGAKIRAATLQKIPYMVIVGQREAEAHTVSVRHRTEGDLGTLSLEQLGEQMLQEIHSKGAEKVTV
jgi:threonyl-tRNA synthetase